jgi:very-long-chain ceramide synthase
MFGVFMVSWLIARHIFYPMVCWSVWAQSSVVMGNGCYSGTVGNFSIQFDAPEDRSIFYMLEPLWDSNAIVCYNETVKWTFLSMLLFLQGLAIMWFSLAIRVAIRTLRGGAADDPRSDDEADEEEEEAEVVYEEAQPLEEEVGVDELDLKNWERRSGVKRPATTATGVSLPGHSDRKELLGRIGCEKQVD